MDKSLKFLTNHKFLYIYATLLIIVCYALLPLMNYEYLFTLQEHSFWVKGHTFMTETVNDHGGWIVYISTYLTQYFYHPWLGSTIIIAIWVFIYFLLNKTVKLSDRFTFWPLICLCKLPFCLLSLGYWIYYDKCPGYAFVPTAYALIIALIAFIINLPLQKIKNEYFTYAKASIIVLAILLISPYTVHNQFAVTMSDSNFRHELNMIHALEEYRYQDIIEESPKVLDKDHEHPTNLMVMMRNIALLNTDQLIEKMFEYDNTTVLPTMTDSLKVHLASQAGSLLYYHYGLVNYAYRWAIENSVKNYMTFDRMKMLIRCAIFNKEFEVAMKYINILKASTFHRDWAKEHEAWIMDNRLFMESQDYQFITPLLVYDNELDSDNSNVMLYILEHYSNFNFSDYPKEELSMASSLFLRYEEEFMIHFLNFTQNHPQDTAPIIAQQAAYLLGPTELSPVDVSQYPFDIYMKTLFQNFNQDYQAAEGKEEAQKANSLRDKYGNTYWWYYYFQPELKYY